jgi:hypothetical protein
MPKKKEPPLTPKEQRRRFEELARESGASSSPKELREVLGRIAHPKRSKDKTDKR